MMRLTAISLLLAITYPAATPAMAQIAAPSGQPGVGPGPTSAESLTSRGHPAGGVGVICNELIAGTFCTSGRSGGGGYGAFTAGTSAGEPSLPPCTSGMPANELCN